MNVIVINGGPRKTWNMATLLNKLSVVQQQLLKLIQAGKDARNTLPEKEPRAVTNFIR